MLRGFKAALLAAVFFAGPMAPAAGHDDLKDPNPGMSASGEHWSAPAAAAMRRNPVALNAAAIEEGRRLFTENCISCHGASGRGDGPAAASLKPRPADLAIMAGHHPDGDLAWKIAIGRGAMPPWKGTLSERQIWMLVAYIKSLPDMKSQPGSHEHRH
jgi:mono/diheme cytochrome c family protein